MRRRSCQRCRLRKLRCGDERPCRACELAGVPCQSRDLLAKRAAPRLIAPGWQDAAPTGDPVMMEESSVLGLSRTLLAEGWQFPIEQDSEAIPGSHGSYDNIDSIVWRRYLNFSLPASPTLELVIDAYFQSVNWFMMVVVEETFREKASGLLASDYALSTDRNFIHLLSLVVGMGAHYLWTDTDSRAQMPVLDFLRKETIKGVEVAYFEIISQPDAVAVQIAILLGSFHLFNGRPYLGFGILGSGIKCAQAIGLHRQNQGLANSAASQEYCRIWWALEIFEKYASVAFGIPCGIDDSDVNVLDIEDLQPSSERRTFTDIVYHRLKCKLYRIMGPFLGRRRQVTQLRTLPDIHAELTRWYDTIPSPLSYEQFQSGSNSTQPALIQMQAVALHLAYDNLQIVLHRQAVFPQKDKSHATNPHRDLSLQQLYKSALRTATALSFAPIDRICRSSHAAMHVGICSFSAGVVICALLVHQSNGNGSSNTLSDEQRIDAIAGLQKIVALFEDFPGQNYRLAAQSLQILKALQSKMGLATVSSGSGSGSTGQASDLDTMPLLGFEGMQDDMFSNILQSVGSTSFAQGGVGAAGSWPTASSGAGGGDGLDASLDLGGTGNMYDPTMGTLNNEAAGQMWLWNPWSG